MGITIGPFDPVKMTIEVLNTLIKKGIINVQEADDILRKSMPNLSDNEKTKIIESLKGGSHA